MKVRYFVDTDTLFIQLSDRAASETKDLNENVLLDIDDDGKVVSLTVEHAMQHTGRLDFSYEPSMA
ncbi:MAG: DUF2283 domain-containing protein [Phycisphaerales bacterium]|nr:DUF2283 domain-containing protein [Phycisphaerales bacterium]